MLVTYSSIPKPKIRLCRPFGWICQAAGITSFGANPTKAFIKWRQKYDFATRAEQGYNNLWNERYLR